MWRNNQGDLQLSHNYYVVFLSVSRVKTTITKIGARRRFRRATVEKMEWSPLMLHCSARLNLGFLVYVVLSYLINILSWAINYDFFFGIE
ncbi:hypothetical protein RHGRI_011446 [Rhododendron griersonianum]|uniref:Transmembrane protein n=1 Tax=Rhododendron griersonianum TaxID=479676 RepID=A0AAV6KME0_9ERIC|nr:hypothetical protein RHGRI_011446 [Rhododendron griersonianum]